MNQHLQTALGIVVTALAAYIFGINPAQTEVTTQSLGFEIEARENAANSEMIRTELQQCLAELKACWKECK